MSQASELIGKMSAFKAGHYAETPYNAARREWNDRTGALVRQAHHWRVAFFAQTLVSVSLVAGILYQGSRAHVVPYLIEHDAASGNAVGLGTIPAWHYSPQVNEYRHFLSAWLERVRSVSLDPVVVKHNWLEAYAFLTRSGANELNQWAERDARLTKIGEETVDVQILSINPIQASHSFQIRWRETTRTHEGLIKDTATWTGTFPVTVTPPSASDPVSLRINPLGIRIEGGFEWSRDLTS